MITSQCLAEIDPHAIGISLIVLASVSPLILAVILHYLKKRLDHRQIMAAIEKGVPLSEIMPLKPQPVGPAWIRYVSGGVAMVIIGLGVIWCGGFGREPEVVVAFVVFGVGAGWLTRGVLHRKYYLQDKAAEEASTAEK
ncbi:MAG TPA: hypothetical protein VJJ98_01210 [Sedimentisphaerales bacterium]|nr:hypothetical protein [Sedimentisphaerales bacterium]